jgi:hypothetical protein
MAAVHPELEALTARLRDGVRDLARRLREVEREVFGGGRRAT